MSRTQESAVRILPLKGSGKPGAARRFLAQLRLGALLAACLTMAAAVAGDAAPATAPENVIRVAAGNHRAFAPPFAVQRVAVGDHAIADIRVVSPTELLVQGKRPGFTSLLVWEKKRGGPVKNFFIQVDRPLPPADAAVPPGALAASGEQVSVQGSFTDAGAHQAALAAARQAAGGDKGTPVLDRSTIAAEGQVQVDVRIVEMKRSVLKAFGLNLLNTGSDFTVGIWAPASLSKLELAGSVINSQGSIPIAEAFQLGGGSGAHGMLRLLSVLERNGMARTLAQPSLVAVSGQSASFMAGGEFPIPIAQSLGQVTVTYKPYGIRLQLTPTVFNRDRIAIKLAPEVSEIDFTTTVNSGGVSVPGVLTRRADTTVELADGESFVIGGLVSQSMIDNVDKVPLLGDIPILGAFFKRMRYSREDKELVIIATPRLVRPVAAGTALPLPGAEYDAYDPSWMRVLLYQRDPFEVESAGFSR